MFIDEDLGRSGECGEWFGCRTGVKRSPVQTQPPSPLGIPHYSNRPSALPSHIYLYSVGSNTNPTLVKGFGVGSVHSQHNCCP